MVKKNNYLQITLRIRNILTTLSLIPLAVFVFSLPFEGYRNSDIFLIYWIFASFTLPALIAKVILKRRLLSLYTVLAFLIYPAIYLVSLGLTNILNISIVTIYNIFGVFVLFAWHYLLIKYIRNEDFENIDESFTAIALSLIPLGVFLFLVSFARDYASIISTDILVHKTVLNGMEVSKNLSIMPAGYSNMFTDQGYPIVFYHTFLFFIQSAFNLDFVRLAYYIDFVFTFITSVTLFKVFKRYFKTYGWSVLGSLLTILIFENIAYTTQYFLPQTFAFWFFLLIISNGKLKLWELIIAISTLITAHLFMGTYFAGILFIKTTYIENYLLNERFKHKVNLLKELFFILVIAVLLSFAGFSIESTYQQSTLNEIGIISNPDFKNKFIVISTLAGAMTVVYLIAFIKSWNLKVKNTLVYTSIIALVIGLIMYFLAPTFAAKFFLGFGFFANVLLLTYISKLRFGKKIYQSILALLLVLALSVNFIQQYNNNLPFLEQSDGFVSAKVNKDNNLINFWVNSKPECVVISDPQTQISLHSFGKGNSMRGYYMTLETRRYLAEFMKNPSDKSLSRLYETQEIPSRNTPLCIVVSARLREIVDYNYAWTNVIYNYKVDHTSTLSENDRTVVFLKQKGFKEIYSDSYFRVFQIR